jgi:fructan beta-fructosidase
MNPSERPAWHFTPRRGWINDPNGLVYDGAQYHLFAQHNPVDIVPGAMHWLHATSPDLLHWQERGIALAPDALGEIYSGSAVLDRENTAGFGAGALVCVFTHHGAREQQSLAYSLDGGSSFTKYAHNPVLENHHRRNFRDPKVFQTAQGWHMVLAAGKELLFYRSSDLRHWTHSGTLPLRTHGVLECPDVFPLDGAWVLVYSVNGLHRWKAYQSYYQIGHFDGDTFHAHWAPQRLDWGADHYAAATFSGTDEVIQLGWASHWGYSHAVPAEQWRGAMTLPRRLSLRSTAQGLRLAATPVLPTLPEAHSVQGHIALTGEAFMLKLTAPGAFVCTLQGAHGERFRFGRDAKGCLFANRRHVGGAQLPAKMRGKSLGTTRTPPLGAGDWCIVYDHGLCEIFADNGLTVCTFLVGRGEKTEGRVVLEGLSADFCPLPSV